MYVKDWMVKDPCIIGPNDTISKALDIMQTKKYHRLPVVDENGKLLGLLTESRVMKNSPNNATSLSVRELNYLLNKLIVKDVMVKADEVKTITPDALLEEAASIMRKHHIGCLPVIEGDKVVGIITHNDIFDAFIDLLGYNQDGTRYVINCKEDRPGVFKEISRLIADMGVNISKIGVYHTERGIEVVVITVGENSDTCKDKLVENGYGVTSVTKITKKELNDEAK